MNRRHYTGIDRLLIHADVALKALAGGAQPVARASPAADAAAAELTPEERAESARLMRVNHCGEVCAQALYQGQSLTASDPAVARDLARAAREEADHLAWCEERLRQLDGSRSLLNPVWYLGSLALGAAVGALGDRFSLGFLAATEEQVCRHLDGHLDRLPVGDAPSRAVLQQMRADEAAHAQAALDAGGARFPAGLKRFMWRLASLMTESTYRL